MSTVSQTQVAAALNISVLAVWSLSSNPSFPQPVSGSNQSVLWDAGQFATFEALWTAAKANGWQLPTAILPRANFAAMAAGPPGLYYGLNPPGQDRLFDDYP